MSDELNEGVSGGLDAKFAKAYKAIVTTDLEILRLKRKTTPEHWDLGDIAIQKKAEVGHTNWIPWLKERAYIERTVQNSMKIRRNFENRDDCIGLTVEQALHPSVDVEALEEEADKIAKKAEESGQKAAKNAKEKRFEAAKTYAKEQKAELDKEEKELAAAAGEEQPEQLLTEGTVGGPSLHAMADALGITGEEDEEEKLTWDDLWNYVVRITGSDAETLTDAESQAIDACIAAIGDNERALQVMLIKCRELLNDVQ